MMFGTTIFLSEKVAENVVTERTERETDRLTINPRCTCAPNVNLCTTICLCDDVMRGGSEGALSLVLELDSQRPGSLEGYTC